MEAKCKVSISMCFLFAVSICIYLTQAPTAHSWWSDTHQLIASTAIDLMPGGLDWFFSTSTGYGNTIIQYSSIEPSPSYTHYYHVDVPHDESDTSEGTLPWAVEDSFDMFVQDLQANNWSDAAQLAGKIAHYIGDGSNPLHATWNYNPPPPPGPGGGHGLYEGAVNGHLNEIDMSMLSSPRVIANVFDSTVHLLVESYCHTSVLIPYLSQSPPFHGIVI